jgi:hypothetical protein
MSLLARAQLAQVEAELRKREAADGGPVFDPTSALTGPQLLRYAEILKSRAAAVPAGRRSGKTDLFAKLLPAVATARNGVQAIYGTTSIKRAIDLLWLPIVEINRARALGGVPNWSTHSIAFPNGSIAKLTGFENKKQANEQARGKPKVALWILDECQDFDPELLRYLYEDCIKPSFADVGGRAVFGGTGAAPRGYWYDLAHTIPGVARFPEWTAHSNPFLEVSAEELIAEACRDQGVGLDAPSIQKEWFGRFVVDSNTQIFPYDAGRNGFDRGEWDARARRWVGGDLPAGRWQFVLSADFGTVDAFGWSVIGWSDASPKLWLLETDSQTGQGSGAQIEAVKAVADRYGDGLIGVVGDPGGGGASHIVTLRQQHWVPIEAAAKADKASACITMRDALRTARLMVAKAEGAFVTELQKPEWDPEAVGAVIRGHFPDRVDAALYGFRKAAGLHHFTAPPPEKTDAQKAIDAMIEAQARQQSLLREMGLA